MSLRTRLSSIILHPSSFLLALAILAYAPFFWERGFYWDEAPWTWIYYRLGPAALTQTFSTSRPFWGLIYQFMLPLVGPQPWAWQLLMILLRWLSAVLVWKLFSRIFPQSRLPLLAAALFLVYPGLGQNFIALMYTHFYIVFNAFLLSLYFSLLAIQKRDWRWHLPALALSVVNLLTMEYFYFLEFFRFLLIFILLDQAFKARIWRAARAYLPYLFTFLAVTFWRAFFFSNQNASYSYQTLTDLKTNFLFGIGKLLWNMLQAFWTTLPAAWLLPFEPVNTSSLGLFTTIAAFGLALAATLLSGLYFLRISNIKSRISNIDLPITNYSFLILGLSAWMLGGGALWLVGERTLPQLHFSADRFSLPLMLGSSLILAALLGLLSRFPRLQLTLLALLIGFSVGEQFQINALYRRDWNTQRAFFWQMSWRIPSLQPGTTLLSNDLPLTVFSDNSLSGPLNWIYNSTLIQPVAGLEGQSRDPGMNYILYYASVRTQEGRALGPDLQPGITFEQNYLAATFHGSTSQMLVVNFSPPGCFRVLDPEIDPLNRLLPPELRAAAFLSRPALIGADGALALPDFYGTEIPRGWCYYFSQAELARQRADWQAILGLYRQALAHGDSPNDPLENFVFIEALAQSDQSQKALSLTRATYRVSREFMRPPLCALWTRIQRDSASGPERDEMTAAARELLACP
ncbi:MAG: hypothetical protein RBS68_11440 [Anaerolineales bacterium]|jgi:hypothetical protein|nr:hypothetical protein [Anaerolineales bacterium]